MSTPPIPDPLANENVPMIFDDGTKGMVPRSKVLDAVRDGGSVAHYVQFDDGSSNYVPHERIQGALQDGGKIVDPSELRQQKDLTPTPPTLGDYGELGASTALMMAPMAGASRLSGPAIQAADKLPVPSMKVLWELAKRTTAEAEVAGAKVSSVGWKQFADTAYKGAAEARQVGATAKALAYDAAGVLSKTYSKAEAAWAWVGEKIPGAPIAIKIAVVTKLLKEGYDSLTGDDKEDARKTIWGEK